MKRELDRARDVALLEDLPEPAGTPVAIRGAENCPVDDFAETRLPAHLQLLGQSEVFEETKVPADIHETAHLAVTLIVTAPLAGEIPGTDRNTPLVIPAASLAP